MSVVRQEWNGSAWLNAQQGIQTFVSPTHLEAHQMDWSGSAWVPAVYDTIYHLYYNGAAGITNNPAVKNIQCNIFPVPASSYVDISLTQNENNPVTISILNMQGQLVMKWNLAPEKNFTQRVSVNDMPSGQYVLYINNRKEEVYKQFTVSK